jgi:hypothetical protein
MRRIGWFLLVVWFPVTLWAAEDAERFEDCEKFIWEMDPWSDLGAFRLYVSQTSGVYRIDPKDPKKSVPNVIIPAIPTMVTSVLCKKLTLPRPGHWYAVLTAVNKQVTMERGPTNEITFTYGNQTPVPPKEPPPVAWVPPWGDTPYVIPPPLPSIPKMPPIEPPPPRPVTGDWLLSESCLWKGTPCPD